MQYYTYDHSDVLDRTDGLVAQLVSWVKSAATRSEQQGERPCRLL